MEVSQLVISPIYSAAWIIPWKNTDGTVGLYSFRTSIIGFPSREIEN